MSDVARGVLMAILEGQEFAIVHANFVIDSRVQLFVESQEQFGLCFSVQRQVARFLRILLQVVDLELVLRDQLLVSDRTVEPERREVAAEPVAAVEYAAYGASIAEIGLQRHELRGYLGHGLL